MKTETRERLQSGEPRELEDGGCYFEFCCDCELTHMFTVDVDPKKKTATITYYRDDHRTEKYRAKEKIVIYRRK